MLDLSLLSQRYCLKSLFRRVDKLLLLNYFKERLLYLYKNFHLLRPTTFFKWKSVCKDKAFISICQTFSQVFFQNLVFSELALRSRSLLSQSGCKDNHFISSYPNFLTAFFNRIYHPTTNTLTIKYLYFHQVLRIFARK